MTTTPTLARRPDDVSPDPPDIDAANALPEDTTGEGGPPDEPAGSEVDDDDPEFDEEDPDLDDIEVVDKTSADPDSAVEREKSVAELGQATTEYALVLLGAALVALLLIGWATSGGGAGKVGHLLDTVLDAITKKL